MDFTLYGLDLLAGEALMGNPTFPNLSPDLTITEAGVNVAAFKNRAGGTCAARHGVVFRLAGGLADTDYKIVVQCATSRGQILSGVCPLEVRA